MRRFIAFLLLTSLFVLPFSTGCFPSGYEEDNPARPDENQVDVDSLDPPTEPAPEEPVIEEPAPEEPAPEEPSGD